jgi:hypothetical protein
MPSWGDGVGDILSRYAHDIIKPSKPGWPNREVSRMASPGGLVARGFKPEANIPGGP